MRFVENLCRELQIRRKDRDDRQEEAHAIAGLATASTRLGQAWQGSELFLSRKLSTSPANGMGGHVSVRNYRVILRARPPSITQ